MFSANVIIDQTARIMLCPTTITQLDWVIEMERHKDNADFVYQWSYETHKEALNDAAIGHYVIKCRNTGNLIGYVILDDLHNASASINLRRLVIGDKGQGYGRETLKLIKSLAFNQLHANRLWLDVAVDNEIARALYASVGFIQEGILRESYLRHGQYISEVIMSVLAREFEVESATV